MIWMHSSLHRKQYQSSQLFNHWSARLEVPHTEHLRRSTGSDFLRIRQIPQPNSPIKMATRMAFMIPLQHNDFHVNETSGLTTMCDTS
jgi:hypothetical protein